MTPPLPSPKPKSCVDVRQEIITLQGWPTDVVSVDYSKDDNPHTVIVFIPGNRKFGFVEKKKKLWTGKRPTHLHFSFFGTIIFCTTKMANRISFCFILCGVNTSNLKPVV